MYASGTVVVVLLFLTCLLYILPRPVPDAVSLDQMICVVYAVCDLRSCRAFTTDDDSASPCRMNRFDRPTKT